jgi:NAD(P)-dependent dehydrogenase (short-subunit alcohol dehydrogenase family)
MSLAGLNEQSIIITAAGSGIGRALAHRLVKEGAHVVVGDIDADRAHEVASELGETAVAVVVDAGEEGAFDRLFAAADSAFGRVDGLVNNAGITAPRVEICDVDVADFKRLIRVNVLGTFRGIQAMLRRARATERGAVVVNTSSGLAVRAAPHHSIYAATKAAVVSLTHTAAAEGATLGVRVNAIVPGPTATPTLLAAPAEKQEQYRRAVPMGRFGTPEEVASVAAWLLSSESSFVTGIAIPIDGGQTA